MSVTWECCTLSSRGLCDGLIPLPGEYHRLWVYWVRLGATVSFYIYNGKVEIVKKRMKEILVNFDIPHIKMLWGFWNRILPVIGEFSQLPRPEGTQDLHPNVPVFSRNLQQNGNSGRSRQVINNNKRRRDCLMLN